MTFPRILPALLMLAACNSVGKVDEKNYAEKSAEVYCRQIEKCSRGFFESEYSDYADCLDESVNDFEDTMDAADEANCDFDEEEAQDCLDTFAGSTCEEVYEGDAYDDCDRVFDCRN